MIKRKAIHIKDIEDTVDGSVTRFFRWCGLPNPAQSAAQYRKTLLINQFVIKLLALYKNFQRLLCK